MAPPAAGDLGGRGAESGPLVPNSLLFARAAEDVRVLLLGEGADELFGGYLRFKTALPPLGYLPARLAAALYGTRKLGAARDFYAPALEAARAQEDPLASCLGPALAQRGARRLAALLDFERRVQLPNAHLPRVDLLSMAHALEVRLPFLDAGVVSLSERVPLAAKVGWRDEKMILREAARGLLPPEILGRRKQGQANPLRLWEAAGLLDRAADLLAAPAVRARGLFQPAAVDRLLARLRRGRGAPFDRNRLHFLVLIEIWHRVFLDPDRLASAAMIHQPNPKSPGRRWLDRIVGMARFRPRTFLGALAWPLLFPAAWLWRRTGAARHAADRRDRLARQDQHHHGGGGRARRRRESRRPQLRELSRPRPCLRHRPRTPAAGGRGGDLAPRADGALRPSAAPRRRPADGGDRRSWPRPGRDRRGRRREGPAWPTPSAPAGCWWSTATIRAAGRSPKRPARTLKVGFAADCEGRIESVRVDFPRGTRRCGWPARSGDSGSWRLLDRRRAGALRRPGRSGRRRFRAWVR